MSENVPQNNAPFEHEELERVVESGNIHHCLNNSNYLKTGRIIFGNNNAITQDFYQNTIVAGNYIDFDLEKHGYPDLLGHIRLLTEYFQTAIHLVNRITRNKSDKVLFIGEGQGRTAIAAIEIAKQLGVKEIRFNDLFDQHIEHIREKIATCYGTRTQNIDGIEISFSSGDFTKIAEETRERFDAIFAMWIVTSEIADFSSVEALQKSRKKLYSQVKKLLTKQGVFIEDIPFSEGIGAFYYTARLKTYKVLHELNILEGENDHMLLTDFSNIQSTGFPYHIRYIPSNGKHRKELEEVGLCENESTITLAPNGIRFPELYAKEVGSSERIRKLFEGNLIEEIVPYLEQKEKELLLYPRQTSILARKTKTTLWRSQYPRD